ncbi:DUF885 domain-containing protein [Streptomyces sp. NPDC006333]|uniref:DUF885 domain-containing protein n=1 Tax=Streptomyces sp. NPDC006333 TaxID=3156753 RepID=UPI0033B508DE
MVRTAALSGLSGTALPRQIADAYLEDLIALDPITGSFLGVRECDTRLPDFSPAGRADAAALIRGALARLDVAERIPGAKEEVERRCARLLRERLTAELAVYEADEELRTVSNTHSPIHAIRDVFSVMPTDSTADWEAVAERLRAVPAAVEGYRECLALGLKRELYGGPHTTGVFVGQLTEWAGDGTGWFEEFVAPGPDSLRAELEAAACGATAALAALRDWMREEYAPLVADAPDVVGRERYALWSRFFNGTDLDLGEAYAYGWSEYHRLLGEMCAEAERVLPGAESPWAALRHLDEQGTHIEGVEEVRAWLQGLMDEAIEAIDGTHFELAERVRKVEARIAPEGGAAAPYYFPPSEDFSRPGTTWLPTMGRTRFPVYDLVSTWYHEGVPGHHLQLAQWVHKASSLSRYQSTVGWVSANCEGWALYAERLMDELGFLTDPERRLGHLDAQMMRAVRVIIDIGMHLEMAIPADSAFHPGERWTPGLAEEFFRAHSGRPAEFVSSELTRYLSMPGQAIGYKLGERAWLLGRENARRHHGESFDLKAWHMAALSLGSLGLDDLVDELSKL